MLYVVSTPIGNLGDITYRAVEALRSCDYILCEDTRHSIILLNHYEIKKPLKSYHKFNEKEGEEKILADLRQGLSLALISDAGTPGIADPGLSLLVRCQEEKLPVTVIPGPCAAIAALSLSALNSERFQFVGFLPKKASQLKKALLDMLVFSGISICYETPHRIEETMEALVLLDSERKVALVRELTKKYEERLGGTAKEVLDQIKQTPPKGEIVLLIQGETRDISLDPKELVHFLETTYGLSLQEAIKLAASLGALPKRELYQLIHEI